jgi:hypothetical protein
MKYLGRWGRAKPTYRPRLESLEGRELMAGVPNLDLHAEPELFGTAPAAAFSAISSVNNSTRAAGAPVEGKPWLYEHFFHPVHFWKKLAPEDFEVVIDWGDERTDTITDIQDAGGDYKAARSHMYLEDDPVHIKVSVNIVNPEYAKTGWKVTSFLPPAAPAT